MAMVEMSEKIANRVSTGVVCKTAACPNKPTLSPTRKEQAKLLLMEQNMWVVTKQKRMLV